MLFVAFEFKIPMAFFDSFFVLTVFIGHHCLSCSQEILNRREGQYNGLYISQFGTSFAELRKWCPYQLILHALCMLCTSYMAMGKGSLSLSFSLSLPLPLSLSLLPSLHIFQWRIQDLRKGGAKSIARKAHAQIFKPRPQIGDHAHQLTRSWK